MDLSVKTGFKEFLTPLSEEELTLLEESIKKDGCRDPLIIWKGKNVLIDGHHRYKICKKYNVEFQIKEINFKSEEEAVKKMIECQFGRRNLTSEQKSYMRGKLYNLKKDKWGGDRKSKYKIDNLKNTAKEIAKQHIVSTSTITKDAKFSEKLDDLVTEHGEDFKKQVLSPADGKRRYSKVDIDRLYDEPVDEQKEIIKLINSGEAEDVSDAGRILLNKKLEIKKKKKKEQKRKKTSKEESSLNNKYEATIQLLREISDNLNDLAEVVKNSNISFDPLGQSYFHTVWMDFIEAVKNFNDAMKKSFVEVNLLPLGKNNKEEK